MQNGRLGPSNKNFVAIYPTLFHSGRCFMIIMGVMRAMSHFTLAGIDRNRILKMEAMAILSMGTRWS